MLTERAAIDEVGFPPDDHWAGFKQVAKSEESIVVSRAVGPTCTMLIEEGYAMKGFRIHGKSCNWGPMAGFVVRDPRISKKGLAGAKDNRKAHTQALTDSNNQGWRARTAPIRVSTNRVRWLGTNNRQHSLGITFQESGFLKESADSGRVFRFTARGSGRHRALASVRQMRFQDLLASKGGVDIAMTLVEESPNVWGLFIDHDRQVQQWRKKFVQECATHTYLRGSGRRYEQLLGMANPYPEYPGAGREHLNVVTGDYDLFAVWPLSDAYEHTGKDRRVVGRGGMSEDGQTQSIFRHEQVKIGNISDRVYMVAQMLNSVIGALTGLPLRNVCFHSDEFGRPMVNDIDAPLIAFIPLPGTAEVATVGVSERTKVADFKDLVMLAIQCGYHVTLHPAWAAEAGLNRALVAEWNGPISRAGLDWYFRQ